MAHLPMQCSLHGIIPKPPLAVRSLVPTSPRVALINVWQALHTGTAALLSLAIVDSSNAICLLPLRPCGAYTGNPQAILKPNTRTKTALLVLRTTMRLSSHAHPSTKQISALPICAEGDSLLHLAAPRTCPCRIQETSPSNNVGRSVGEPEARSFKTPDQEPLPMQGPLVLYTHNAQLMQKGRRWCRATPSGYGMLLYSQHIHAPRILLVGCSSAVC